MIRADVALAAESIAGGYALPAFIAVNPLGGFESTTFDDATARARTLFRARVLPRADARAADATPEPPLDARAIVDAIGVHDTLADICARFGWGDLVATIDERVARWLAAYCDEGQASWPMPHRDLGFYRAWKRLARHENLLVRDGRTYRRALEELPDRADEALERELDLLGVPLQRRIGYLARHLAQSAGWAGYIKQRATNGDASLDLTALLAVRVWYERHAVAAAAREHGCDGTLAGIGAWASQHGARISSPRDAQFDCVAHGNELRALARREREFRGRVLGRIRRDAMSAVPLAPSAQLIFCIDARSEPLRRAIEAEGAFETFGFAGFFGIPLRSIDFDSAESVALAPVLLRPTLTVEAAPAADRAAALRRDAARTAAREAFIDGVLSHPVTAFAAVEGAGIVAAVRAAWKTFAGHRAARPLRDESLSIDTISLEQRVFFAEAALRMIGLTCDIAPVVVLCGHGGTTVNNAFSASLDCGACGGNPGRINARVAALIFNDPRVRRALSERGIAIPPHTVFVAAEHDTTRDEIAVVDCDLDTAQRSSVAFLQPAFAAATTHARAARQAFLPPSPLGLGGAHARSGDWAQVRPEWGLARNAGFVIGPRALTRESDLDGRCFLHSYDPVADDNGSVLEQILTAPLVVAEWINMQYFFATVDSERFGSGDKVMQQAVGGIGVQLGNGGDLRLGLPLQSTTLGDEPYHEPLRLQAFIYAPAARIDTIIARQAILQRLFNNRWVHCIAIDPSDGIVRRYAGNHEWHIIPARDHIHA